MYTLSKPYVLGGEYALENIDITDIEAHFSLLGQIHSQVKDPPDGTDVSEIRIR